MEADQMEVGMDYTLSSPTKTTTQRNELEVAEWWIKIHELNHFEKPE
ncbi:MAG: hypothetical protein ACI8YQ_004266 [Polaribacter sp.]|jgi:hypothetical protein